MKIFLPSPLWTFVALAAGSRRAKTPKAVECEASQSGPQGNAQSDAPNPFSTPSLNPGGNEE